MPEKKETCVNDFSILVATVNGSGSQTANNVLIKSIFQMGVPVSGKNIFPSNIAGLPTWFSIRVNKNSYLARKKRPDILIALNQETFADDIRGLKSGGVVIHESAFKITDWRGDLIYYPVPFGEISARCCPDLKLRKYVTNMIYVGVVGALLGIEQTEMESALGKIFRKKQKALDVNLAALRAGFEYAETSIEKRDQFRIEKMNGTTGKILIDGNYASAVGAIFACCAVCAWYPITPASTLGETMAELARKYRRDKATGKLNCAVVQAEDELSSIGIVLGAGWAGVRAMTCTSGPGISLMAEFCGLGYFAEIPAVIFNIQRVGPSTGLPTRTSQGDILETAFLSHGDTRHVMLFPCSPSECYYMTFDAFDLAERLQTPIFVMSDLDIGMNSWLCDEFEYNGQPPDRGKVLDEKEIEELVKGGSTFERYRDVDGDGIPYRTLPGNRHPSGNYFTRGSGHNEKAQYSEKPEDYRNLMDRLAKKFETARNIVPGPEIHLSEGAEIGIIAYGSTDAAIRESRDLLAEEGIKTSYLRIRSYPFSKEVKDFIEKFERVYVVEQNRDGQMRELIILDLGVDCGKVRSVLHYNGIPLDAETIVQGILSQEFGSVNEVNGMEYAGCIVGGE